MSLAEDLDAVAALSVLPWSDRATVRDAYAATLVKRQVQRPTFEALFDLWFPRLVGAGLRRSPPDRRGRADGAPVKDGPAQLADLRERLAEALESGGERDLADLAVEAVERFGEMPGRAPGLSGWSAYTALRRVSPDELVDRIVAGLLARGPHRRRGAPRRGPAGRCLHRPGRGRRPAPDRGGEGPRPPRRRRGPADHRPARLHRRAAPPTSRRCAARSTRSPGGSRPGWRGSSTPGAAARSTYAARSGPRSPPAASR